MPEGMDLYPLAGAEVPPLQLFLSVLKHYFFSKWKK